MKKVLLCIFFLAPLPGFAIGKIDSVVYISKIPKNGFLLDKGWKFHAGDNSDWVKPDLSDTNWAAINPTTDIYYLPQVRNAEIGWFRLKLNIGASATKQSLALNISQVGASEIYLNGRLIYNFGKVAKDYKAEQTFVTDNKPLAIKFDDQSTQVVAVRYSFNRKNLLINYLAPNPCLLLRLNNTNEAFVRYDSDHEANAVELSVITTLYLLLGVMSLFLYFSLKTQSTYLYLGLICIFAAGSIVFAIIDIALSSKSLSILCLSLLCLCSYISELISAIILLQFVYTLCKKRKNISYYVLMFYGAFSIPALIFLYKWSALICFSFFVLNYLEVIRLLLITIRHKIPGALILLTTYVFAVLLTMIFIYELGAGNFQAADFAVTIALVIVPIGLSFFLASGYARTGRALQARVVEVEQLSEKTIAQEQEKQQILASQNVRLEEQVTERTAELNQSLTHLKATQTQLIQSEKMASLGELTAGIAHEIQNPLNFVNNFSEVNTELIGELKLEADKGDLQEIKAIAGDIEENSKKINIHGNRAAAIVKGMLEHSRAGSGVKEPTDINKLADEYLRLSYHGLRAKDKSFNAEMVTNFDVNLPKVNVIPQDIGRVLLNLLNNAFYAVNQKKKAVGEGHNPEVIVSTSTENGQLIIKVKDNGIGIPDAIKEKIMQPFFTTKPTGEGTGLGLSLTYDMVVKGHGGSIQVESIEGGGSEFIIKMPIN